MNKVDKKRLAEFNRVMGDNMSFEKWQELANLTIDLGIASKLDVTMIPDNIESLNIHGNFLSDLEGTIKLERLKELFIACNDIELNSPTIDAPNLLDLEVEAWAIKDLSGLLSNNLRHLSLSGGSEMDIKLSAPELMDLETLSVVGWTSQNELPPSAPNLRFLELFAENKEETITLGAFAPFLDTLILRDFGTVVATQRFDDLAQIVVHAENHNIRALANHTVKKLELKGNTLCGIDPALEFPAVEELTYYGHRNAFFSPPGSELHYCKSFRVYGSLGCNLPKMPALKDLRLVGAGGPSSIELTSPDLSTVSISTDRLQAVRLVAATNPKIVRIHCPDFGTLNLPKVETVDELNVVSTKPVRVIASEKSGVKVTSHVSLSAPKLSLTGIAKQKTPVVFLNSGNSHEVAKLFTGSKSLTTRKYYS